MNARVISRSRRSLVLELAVTMDPVVVAQAIEIERDCCPFFTLAWEPDRRRLGISVSAAEREPALEAIASALGLSAPTGAG